MHGHGHHHGGMGPFWSRGLPYYASAFPVPYETCMVHCIDNGRPAAYCRAMCSRDTLGELSLGTTLAVAAGIGLAAIVILAPILRRIGG